MIATCFWDNAQHLNPIAVAIIEANSGPGGTLYACPACLDTYRIVPLAEHPSDTDGRIRYRTKRQTS